MRIYLITFNDLFTFFFFFFFFFFFEFYVLSINSSQHNYFSSSKVKRIKLICSPIWVALHTKPFTYPSLFLDWNVYRDFVVRFYDTLGTCFHLREKRIYWSIISRHIWILGLIHSNLGKETFWKNNNNNNNNENNNNNNKKTNYGIVKIGQNVTCSHLRSDRMWLAVTQTPVDNHRLVWKTLE